MLPRHTRSIALAATIAAAGIVWSQGRGNPNEWPTAYGDAQHTSWIRNDVNISPETMSQPGFELQWKTTLESPVRHGISLSLGRDHIGCEHLHAALHDCRAFQPDLCGRQRHRKPVLDAPVRRERSRRGPRRVPGESPAR